MRAGVNRNAHNLNTHNVMLTIDISMTINRSLPPRRLSVPAVVDRLQVGCGSVISRWLSRPRRPPRVPRRPMEVHGNSDPNQRRSPQGIHQLGAAVPAGAIPEGQHSCILWRIDVA
jgi:hypothetical protein